jgi:hypothetical protein
LQKQEKNLTPAQRLFVELWTGFVPVFKDLLLIKEEFYAIYDAREKQEVYTRYMAWEASIPAALYEAFLPLLLTIEEWGQEIFAFWEMPVPLTNTFTKRTNLSVREATRVTYGLTFRVAGQTALLTSQHREAQGNTATISTARRASFLTILRADFNREPHHPGFAFQLDSSKNRFWEKGRVRRGIFRGSRASGDDL